MGPFWKGRFHSTIIEDTEHLLGCALYVDLNAVKAGIAQGIDDYQYTSGKIRLDVLRSKQESLQKTEAQKADPIAKVDLSDQASIATLSEDPEDRQASEKASLAVPKISKGEFLSVMKMDKPSHDPQLHKGGFRCSDKGFLDYTDKEYLDALEWCIRNKILQRETTLMQLRIMR